MDWLTIEDVRRAHKKLIERHGGSPGLRDFDLLASALSRPANRHDYADAGIFEIAGAYGFGIAKNHPFVYGNKRIGFAAMLMFLDIDGLGLTATEAEAYDVMIGVTDSSL